MIAVVSLLCGYYRTGMIIVKCFCTLARAGAWSEDHLDLALRIRQQYQEWGMGQLVLANLFW
jgi:hypothetical protein